MYSKFNVSELRFRHFRDFYSLGRLNYLENILEVQEHLENYIFEQDIIDGNSLQDNWFPNVQADIFLSHSHKDKNLAIAFSGWLYQELGLNTFIDSSLWGYSNDLLRIIDNEFCKNDGGTYDYQKRNYSTSHVHMMLAISLAKMIDSTECIFFLNTPNSVDWTEDIQRKNSKIFSPWIYHELTMANMVRIKLPSMHSSRKVVTLDSKGSVRASKRLSIRYDVTKLLNKLISVNRNDLLLWHDTVQKSKHHPLDVLYMQHRIARS